MPPYASRVSCDPALTCSAVSSLNHAGISSSATIVGGSGDTSGATLRVMRPDNMSDDAVATYLIQAYSDDKGTAKVGRWAGCVCCSTQHARTDLPVVPAVPNPHQLQCTGSRCPPCEQVGNEVRGNNTAEGADGKSQASAFVFPYPYTTAAKLWFKVTVVTGGTRSPASQLFNLGVVVGK